MFGECTIGSRLRHSCPGFKAIPLLVIKSTYPEVTKKMRHCLGYIAVVAIATVASISTLEARAGLLYGSSASATAQAGGIHGGTQISTGLLTADANLGDANVGSAGSGSWSLSTFSVSRVDATEAIPVLKLEGEATAQALGIAPGAFSPFATSDSKWSDVINLNGSTAQGIALAASRPTLELKVHVSASVSVTIADSRGLYSNTASLSVWADRSQYTTRYGIFTLYKDFHDRKDPRYANGVVDYSGWDDLTFTDGNFNGDLTITLNYIPKYHGYQYALEYLLETSAYIGTASVLSDNSFHLVGLTLADGATPESHGITITSASGISSPNLGVPEPSSLIAAFASTPLVLVYWWCRRKSPSDS